LLENTRTAVPAADPALSRRDDKQTVAFCLDALAVGFDDRFNPRRQQDHVFVRIVAGENSSSRPLTDYRYEIRSPSDPMAASVRISPLRGLGVMPSVGRCT
jgi:hypothetical protein